MNSDRISLANIEKTIGSKKILSDVSFSISANEIVGLLGPNGAGKTTAFYIAAGLIFPNQGRVFINNKDVTEIPMHGRANLGLGYLPQEASIFPDLKTSLKCSIFPAPPDAIIGIFTICDYFSSA